MLSDPVFQHHSTSPPPVKTGRGGSARLVASGMSVLVALALAVNLTCRAAIPMGGEVREGSSEKMPLRQLTLAIHRVVRRLIRARAHRDQPSAGVAVCKHGLTLRRRAVVPSATFSWRSGGLLEALIDLPPPARA